MKITLKRNFFTDIVSSIPLLLILFCALRIESIAYLTPLSSVYYKVSYVLLPVIIFLLFCRRKISIITIVICMLFFVYFISTYINTGTDSIVYALRTCTSPLLLTLMTEYYMKKRPKKYIKALLLIFCVLMACDIYTIISFPKGLYKTQLTGYTKNWLLGYKSARVRSVTMPAITLAAMLDIVDYKRIKLRFYLVSILALADAFLSGATAGVLSMTVEIFIILCIYIQRKEKYRVMILKLFDAKILIFIIFVLNIVFVFLQKFSDNFLISYVITKILEKNITLTGRTDIWTASIVQFIKAPLMGSGYISPEKFIQITGNTGGTQPHNLVLALLVYTGVVGLFLYVILLLSTFSMVNKKQAAVTNIFSVAIIANLIFGIASMNMFGQFHYAMMVFVFYFSCHEKTRIRFIKNLKWGKMV